MSDLHLDVNERYPLYLPDNDRETFTIIAGDTAGEMDLAINWIMKNCPKGVLVAGNHLVYNDYNESITNLKETLKEAFPKDADMKFLDNDYITLDDNTIIVGSTLYTDFMLNGMNQKMGMDIAYRYLNDFRLGIIDDNGERELLPKDYLNMFEISKAYIAKICEDNPNKNIIVVTHHAPSAKSIAKEYCRNETNCAYASDLDDFILNHKNIKVWIHGHVHNYFNYKIGDCRIICNPRGYVRNLEDLNWNPCFYLDTETWETSSDDSWFNREETEEEKKNRQELNDAYEALFKYCL